MSEISNKEELDKLISLAKKNGRNSTISESMVRDVIHSFSGYKNKTFDYQEYLLKNDVIIVSDGNEVEYIDETIDDSAKIKPFDTANIDILPKQLPIGSLNDRLRYDEIDLMPSFQRKEGLWSKEQKSQLIESLILRIPLPAFYFDGSNSDKWVVIDGLQRLSALKAFFVDESLSLVGLEFLHDLNGAFISDMPRAYVRRMIETNVTAFIINPGAPVNLKYNIFKRINTGGLRLELQEIRHALYQGYSTQYLKELADLSDFKEATGYSVANERMLDREFVLRFIAFYEQGLTEYHGSIDHFLNDAMEIINTKYDPKNNPQYAGIIKEKFVDALKLNMELFDRFAFRKMPDIERRRPINKSLFETWTVSLARLSVKERSMLLAKKDELLTRYIRMNKEDDDYIKSLNSAKILSVRHRFRKTQRLIKEILSSD